MFDGDRLHRQRRGTGLLLLLFLVGVLVLPLWYWRGRTHPLAGETSVDLCRRMASLPALADLRPANSPSSGAAGGCSWTDRVGKLRLEATLSTTRGNGGHDVDHLFDIWRDEAKANYGPSVGMHERGSENLRVLAFRTQRGGERLVEDHGILLDLRSEVLDDGALDALIEPARLALRTDPDRAR